MGNPEDLRHLVFSSDSPADIMAKVSHVSAFLCKMVDGDHVKPDSEVVLAPEAVSGLAHILGFIQSASDHASSICK